MKKISYIIPHHNSVDKLERLLKSIEIEKGDEIIIIDDCSDEEYLDRLYEMTKSNSICLLSTDINLGAGAARNIGIKKASNSWLLFADSDDYFVKNYRRIISSYIQEDIDVIYFKPTSKKESKNYSVIGDRHSFYCRLIDDYLNNNEDNADAENNLKYQMVVPWSKLVNKNVIDKYNILFDEVAVSNDVMFATKIGFHSKTVQASNEVIYCCTESNTSITSDITFEKTYSRMKIFVNQYIFLKENLSNSDFKKLNFTGMSYVFKSIKYKYSLSQKKDIFIMLKQNKIKIISISWIINKLKKKFWS